MLTVNLLEHELPSGTEGPLSKDRGRQDRGLSSPASDRQGR